MPSVASHPPGFPRHLCGLSSLRRLTLLSIFMGLCFTGLLGCVVRFANAERSLDTSFRKIYVPAARDLTSQGGQADRLSVSLRRQLALDTRFILVPIDEARWALDVEIRDRQNRTTKTDECDPDVPSDRVGSLGYSCLPHERPFNQAEVSSEQEALTLTVNVRAIDLETGKTLIAHTFPDVSSADFEVVGDRDTQIALSATPEIHALRYVENVDNAVASTAEGIATQIKALLLGLNPGDG